MALKEKILVVDDEPSIRKYLQTLLEVDGFEVETVGSGKEALAKVNAGERPDFIILDVLMPEMNGLDTLKELMQLDRSLNVIMLSCSNEVGTVVAPSRTSRAPSADVGRSSLWSAFEHSTPRPGPSLPGPGNPGPDPPPRGVHD